MGRLMHEARHGLLLQPNCEDVLGHWHTVSHEVSVVLTLPDYLAVVVMVQESARGGLYCSHAMRNAQKTSSIIPRSSPRLCVL